MVTDVLASCLSEVAQELLVGLSSRWSIFPHNALLLLAVDYGEVDLVLWLLQLWSEFQLQNAVADHLWKRVEEFIAVGKAVGARASDDRNGSTWNLPVSRKIILCCELLHIFESSLIHIASNFAIDNFLWAKIALEVGRALKRWGNSLISSGSKRNIPKFIQWIAENVNRLPCLKCSCDRIGGGNGRKDLADEILALVESEVFMFVVWGIIVNEIVGPQVSDAQHKIHAVLVIFFKRSRGFILQLPIQ